jgi:hypothetical protein
MGIRRGDTAHRITSAQHGHSVSLASREKRYALSMGIRTACFVAALFVMDHWYVWIFLALAIFLPYIAVILANVGSSPDPDPLPPVPRSELEGREE